ncbi:hypothetical protein RclHR1_23670005 [Rhizophagus clarus]|uniref:Uncharacterized protein n=1 Tax=Rhizophagus clarus TaxID=94130 RepID=A0A2Z6QY41_9GLOM|nr:hypothetical protein RclHR1_23670005 [Rhizophagus clarus]
MSPSLEVYDTELLKLIKQLHKSRWKIWKLKKEGKIDEHNKRQHMMSRRDQVRKGLQHMIFMQDSILDNCHSENMTREVFIKDCKKAVNTAEVHSDEWSTEDEVLVNEEHNNNIRSGRLISTNSVIKIYNKEWRSSRVKRILFQADEMRVSIRIGLKSDNDDDDEDNDGNNNDDDNNGNNDNSNDDNNGNSDNNDDGNNGNADKNDGTNEEQNNDNNGNLDLDEHQGSFYLEVPVDIRRRT